MFWLKKREERDSSKKKKLKECLVEKSSCQHHNVYKPSKYLTKASKSLSSISK
jgi:hypothetical protein